MLNFENDYSEGAHPKILERLIETNNEKEAGYGMDRYCRQAREKIRKVCECQDADVQFLVGGTQTNQVVIDAMLKPYQGVITAKTGHINTHEAGAIEYTGHKVLELPDNHGKLTEDAVENYLMTFYQDGNHEHMVFPGMVYISHPTEYGTLYSKQELTGLAAVCHKYKLPLYLDGARLGYGLMSEASDLSIADIAALCDVFYIGGTKIGALCGEAVVFTKKNKPAHFITVVKQHGALLAKSRLLGLQFDTLFTNHLYFDLALHAVQTAMILKKGLKEKGYHFYLDSPTNQQFIVIDNEKMNELKHKVIVSYWEKFSDHQTVIRLATSWATEVNDVYALLDLL